MLMDLHQLHDWLLELNIFTTSEVPCFSWSLTFTSVLDSKTILSLFKLVDIIIIERADVSLIQLMLNLVVMMILFLLGAA